MPIKFRRILLFLAIGDVFCFKKKKHQTVDGAFWGVAIFAWRSLGVRNSMERRAEGWTDGGAIL
jgi:hypothetical protein